MRRYRPLMRTLSVNGCSRNCSEMPRKSGARERIKNYLRGRVGEKIPGHQIRAVARATEWARRVREIRDDEGWPIRTHHDDSSLKPGEYMLADEPPEESENYRFAKPISARVRAFVLERNGYTCQMCGAGAGDPDPDNPGRKIRLHIGHIIDRSHGGDNEPGNLRALCSACNQGAKNLAPEPPSWTYLLAQLRRASIKDQKKALEWLLQKFGENI